MKKRGALFYTLLVALVLIWGRVIYGVVMGRLEDNPPVSTLRASAVESPPPGGAAPLRSFDTSLRDPFAVPSELSRSPRPVSRHAKPPPVPEPEPSPPPLSLIGVVDETAMLRGPNDRIVFARAGDEVFDMTIASIAPESVTTRFAGRIVTLTLK